MQSTVMTKTGAAELRQFISFTVGEEEYGLELLRVKEVIRVPAVTWLPRAPSFVKGIINLRGDIIPLVDLRGTFGLEPKAATPATRVIVVEVEGRLVGMIVDCASQVVRIPAGSIDPPPPVLGTLSQEFITGVGRLEDRLVILLDIDAVLTAEEKDALASLDGAGGPGTAAAEAEPAAQAAP